MLPAGGGLFPVIPAGRILPRIGQWDLGGLGAYRKRMCVPGRPCFYPGISDAHKACPGDEFSVGIPEGFSPIPAQAILPVAGDAEFIVPGA